MGRLFQIPDSKFMDDAKNDYKFWRKSFKTGSKDYKNYVKKITKAFGLKDTDKFDTKKSPKFWAGERHNPRFVLVSYNPGLSRYKKRRFTEEDLAKNWNTYKKKRDNDFEILGKKKDHKSRFFKPVYKLICRLDNIECEKKINWDYLQENLLNLNFLPFHSTSSENYPTRFKLKELAVIIQYLALMFEFIEEEKPKLCFFNGKLWETLFIKHGLISEKRITKKVRFKGGAVLYFFKLPNSKTRCVLLNRFLSRSGLKDSDKKLAKKIKKKYKKI